MIFHVEWTIFITRGRVIKCSPELFEASKVSPFVDESLDELFLLLCIAV